jgi:hypothetical protein
MTLAALARRQGRSKGSDTPQDAAVGPERQAVPQRNSISASQARAARRREALRGEQAVAAWLRELSGRSR